MSKVAHDKSFFINISSRRNHNFPMIIIIKRPLVEVLHRMKLNLIQRHEFVSLGGMCESCATKTKSSLMFTQKLLRGIECSFNLTENSSVSLKALFVCVAISTRFQSIVVDSKNEWERVKIYLFDWTLSTGNLNLLPCFFVSRKRREI